MSTAILVTGGTGQLAQALKRADPSRVQVVGRPEFDFDHPETVAAAVRAHIPGLVINAAAYTAVDAAEAAPEAAARANADGPGLLAQACRQLSIPLIHVSTDYVFDGLKAEPYIETDPTAPAGVYGRTKLAGEVAVRAAHPGAVVLRTSWVYARTGRNFVLTMLNAGKRAPRLRVVFTRHAAHTPGRWTRFLAARADRRVVLTEEGMHGFPSSGTRVVPHGVDLTRFHPPPDRAAAWAERGVGGRFGVGVIGRIRRQKGQADFARAWAQARHTDWRAVLVGPVKRSQRRFLREVLEQGGEGLSWVGEQRDPAPWYRGLSVVAQPSYSEGFSLVLLEAMASGCCVVAARLPHFPRWVEHGQTGLLYPPGDAEALAGHLRFLFANRDKAHAMGARAAARAREEMGVAHEAAALGQLYSELLGELRGAG